MFSYLIYYIATLLFNFLLLSMYFVRLYEDFPDCIDPINKQNHKFWFELAYGFGFLVIFCFAFDTNVCAIYFRYKVKREQRKDGFANRRTLLFRTIFDYAQWLDMISILCTTLWQAQLLRSHEYKNCIRPGGELYE